VRESAQRHKPIDRSKGKVHSVIHNREFVSFSVQKAQLDKDESKGCGVPTTGWG